MLSQGCDRVLLEEDEPRSLLQLWTRRLRKADRQSEDRRLTASGSLGRAVGRASTFGVECPHNHQSAMVATVCGRRRRRLGALDPFLVEPPSFERA